MGFDRILIIPAPLDWAVQSLVDDALVVNHNFESTIDDGSAWSHWLMWHRRDFRY